ncbi:MAG: ring-cleaving dioxygenase [Thermodesulfobacteriota bacterium]
MPEKILGIHHITAIAAGAKKNLEFYTKVLGLRLVKKTVNFDDPTTYHFYFGNEKGEPGTILTFFPWEGIRKGRAGTGQVTTVSFSVPEDSMGFWLDRFRSHNVTYNNPSPRFGEKVLVFLDPDGLKLELISGSADKRKAFDSDDVPIEFGIRGFHSAALTLDGYEATAKLLTDVFGYERNDESVNRFRFVNKNSGSANIIDLVCLPAGQRGSVAGGTVHHIAFRTANEGEQLLLREKLISLGYNVTPQLDRNYFKSIYFREPGGVLFEIATDPPGFTVDEDLANLGRGLKLPGWLESRRDEIESALPPID